jgi:hypothetical protein
MVIDDLDIAPGGIKILACLIFLADRGSKPALFAIPCPTPLTDHDVVDLPPAGATDPRTVKETT